MTTPITARPGTLTLAQLRALARDGATLAFSDGWRAPVEAAARTIAETLASGATVYGVNTGFGSLARQRIADDQLRDLQVRLVLSHSAGTGPLLDDDTVRLTLALKANGLARGHSGVRPLVVEALLGLVASGAAPCVPAKGSVGASGDLAPLAHLTAALIGAGEIRLAGEVMPAAAALARLGLAPLTLEPKEGLAMLNGTQVSTALALQGLFAVDDALQAALVAGALSVDAAMGSTTPFDPRLNALRGHPGQTDVAAALAALLAASEIRDSHLDCDRVQDPYSLRCQPQVMGACLEQLRYAAAILEREANAVTDNPLIFADDGAVLSGGNFHAEPVALAADAIAVAIAEIGNLSERRIALLVDANMSGLPAFLVREPGVNSGFMIAQVTAAALASENRTLAHPASVDNIPTSANQEDHVSMATYAARRLHEMADNLAGIVAIELLAAAQGIAFHAPTPTSPPLAAAIAAIRAKVPPYDRDRAIAPDIAAVKALISASCFTVPAVALA